MSRLLVPCGTATKQFGPKPLIKQVVGLGHKTTKAQTQSYLFLIPGVAPEPSRPDALTVSIDHDTSVHLSSDTKGFDDYSFLCLSDFFNVVLDFSESFHERIFPVKRILFVTAIGKIGDEIVAAFSLR